MYIYLLVRKTHFNNDNSTKSDTSLETNFDQDSINFGGGGSENSNDTDCADHKDSLLFEKYRKLLIESGLQEKEAQIVLMLLHAKPEAERKLFMR